MNFIFNLFKMMNIFQKKKSNMNTILVPKTPINSPKKEEENKMEEEDEDVNEIKKKEEIKKIKESIKEKHLKALESKEINNKSDDEENKIEVIDTDKKTKSENINIIKLEDEIEIKRIEINKNLFVRLLESNGEMVVDFCKFYKGFPTKKNIRINLNKFKKLNELLS